MSSQMTEHHSPSLQGDLPALPPVLPRGFVPPPEEVRQLLEQERAKCPPAIFAKSEERLLNEWTVDYYYNGLNLEILYRATPKGPEILAVGWEEGLALKKSWPMEEQLKLKTYLGY